MPGLLDLLGETAEAILDEDLREDLRGALADEMVELGLKADGEPNPYGLQLDDLIGRLADLT